MIIEYAACVTKVLTLPNIFFEVYSPDSIPQSVRALINYKLNFQVDLNHFLMKQEG